MNTTMDTAHEQAGGPANDPTALFERERRRLFGIAYRMLGSVSEAEDVVQDTYVRWHSAADGTVEQPSAYLTRITTRLCLDIIKSARRQRTEYIGPWLPEPLLEGSSDWQAADPAALQDLTDDLSTAFLLMLERLTPLERAVFLLHDSFGYSYEEIAGVVGRSEDYCRQIARRAHKHLDSAPRPKPADPAEHDRLLQGFLAATREGDLQGMVNLLAHDAVLYTDGGGKARAARQPVVGAAHIARFVLGLAGKYANQLELRPAIVNGRTGLLTYINQQLLHVTTMLIADGKIQQVFLVVNPDKLPPDPHKRDIMA